MSAEPVVVWGGGAIGGTIASAIRVAAQWEKALVFRLGRFQAVKGPGLFTILPFFDSVRLVDTRILTIEIPTQQAITKDNVPVSIDGVIDVTSTDASAGTSGTWASTSASTP